MSSYKPTKNLVINEAERRSREIFNISIFRLLSGERFKTEEYKPEKCNNIKVFCIALVGFILDSIVFVLIMVSGTNTLLWALSPIIDKNKFNIHSFFDEVIGALNLGFAPFILCVAVALMLMKSKDGFIKDRLKNLASSLHGVIASIVGFKLVQIGFYDTNKSLEDGVLILGIISLLVYAVFSAIDSSEFQKKRVREISVWSLFVVICVLWLVKCSV
ncbi:TPA: hypothetical protein ACGUOS_003757 [Vibrio vulnificus]|nr:hypothetical protein [Vibrio vulnificus]